MNLKSADTLSPNGLTTISSNYWYGEAAKKITTNRVLPECCDCVRTLIQATLFGRGGSQGFARRISRAVFVEHALNRGYKPIIRRL